MIKGIQQYYSKIRVFHGTFFESSWPNHLADYIENCKHWDVPDNDKVLFFSYTLADSSDAKALF